MKTAAGEMPATRTLVAPQFGGDRASHVRQPPALRARGWTTFLSRNQTMR
jgi:hypothetical protein